MFSILGIIIPTDFPIFQRGRYTTNQHNWLISLSLLPSNWNAHLASLRRLAGCRNLAKEKGLSTTSPTT